MGGRWGGWRGEGKEKVRTRGLDTISVKISTACYPCRNLNQVLECNSTWLRIVLVCLPIVHGQCRIHIDLVTAA